MTLWVVVLYKIDGSEHKLVFDNKREAEIATARFFIDETICSIAIHKREE